MKTLYRYTNNTMAGWEFVMVNDKGEDGSYLTGNTASTVVNTGTADLKVTVKTKRELKDIVQRLEWIGKYTNLGEK
jgi:CRISPR/Cas system endoribonuclease Cas6 (RAMP superfamily)